VNGGWHKLPEAVRRAVLAGNLTTSDVLVAVAISKGAPLPGRVVQTGPNLWGRPGQANVYWLADVTGLSVRAVRYSLAGRPARGREGLAAWVVEDARGFWTWTRQAARRFVRVAAADWRALLARPPLDAVRVWAWTLGRIAGGRPFARTRWEASTVARALGWAAGRAWRAVHGARDRLGALAAGLVDLDDGMFISRAPLDRTRDPVSKAVDKPVEARSGGSPPRAGVDTLWQISGSHTQEISRSRTLLVDLAAAWRLDPAQRAPGGEVDDLGAFQRWLARIRVGAHRGRTWAWSILRQVLAWEPPGKGAVERAAPRQLEPDRPSSRPRWEAARGRGGEGGAVRGEAWPRGDGPGGARP